MRFKIAFIVTLTSLIIAGIITALINLLPIFNFKQILFFVSLFLVVEILLLYGTFERRSPIFGRTFWRGAKSLPAISITFDDGLNEPYTSQILEILKKFKVKATFFVIGENSEVFPETLRKEIEGGHEIGNHTYNHNVLPLKSPRYIRQQIKRTSHLIENAAHVRPRLLRTPHGWRNPWVNSIAKQEGLTTVSWTHGVWDTNRPSAEVIVRRALKGLKNGCVFLFHDGRGTERDFDSSQLVEALPTIISKAQKRGFNFLTLSEMMKEARIR
jgi:peptidoglycan/xylan/chitin deacetylase (PgdA/CDA1 family)